MDPVSYTHLDMGMFYKRRDYSTIVNGKNPIVAHEFLGSDLRGKDLIVIDDMISSGDSMLDVAKQLDVYKRHAVDGTAMISTSLPVTASG